MTSMIKMRIPPFQDTSTFVMQLARTYGGLWLFQAYTFLRQPFGLDDSAVCDCLNAVDISPKQLLETAFSSTWLKGFRLEQLEKERERCLAQVRADDAKAAQRCSLKSREFGIATGVFLFRCRCCRCIQDKFS